MKVNTKFLPSSRSPTPPRRCTFAESIMEESIQNAEAIISKWDVDEVSPAVSIHDHSKDIPFLFSENNYPEAQQFIQAVTDLWNAMHFTVKEGSNRAENLVRIAMDRLQKEFYVMLKANRSFLDPGYVSARVKNMADVSFFQNYNSATSTDMMMEKLRIIADCMVSCARGKDCAYIYNITRKSIIDESLYNMGVENLRSSQIQKMDWDAVEIIAKNWLKAVNTAIKTLFHGERILCDAVFISSESLRDSCFAVIAKDSALMLLSFPEKLVKCKKFLSPERIFQYLDLYETISELWTQIDVIFSSDSLSAVRSQAVMSQLKLGVAVRTMLSQFETAILEETSKIAVPGGGVHPFTRYVMNYLIFLADYSNAVEEIIADWPVINTPPLPESFFPFSSPNIDDETPGSAVSVRLAWIILLLLCKLDGSAVLYKDHVALSYLFLANNWNYVVSKIRNSKLNLLMGPVWIFQQESKVKQFISSYKKIGWIKEMTAFPDDPMAEVSVSGLEECFKRFNAGFKEASRVQSSWVIPDPKLRDEVKILLSKAIVPVYRVFYDKYREILVKDTQEESIVRYAPEDLENYLSELFEGNISARTSTCSASSVHGSGD